MNEQSKSATGLFAEAKQLGIIDPPFNGINYTNRVLIERTARRIVLYCPAYVHLKIKNLVKVSIQDLQAQINSTLIYIVNMKGIPQFLKEYLRSKMVLRFNRSKALVLNEEDNKQINIKEHEKGEIIQYTVRKNILTGMDPDIFLSPFEILNLLVTITAQSVILTSDAFNQLRDQIKPENDEEKNFIKEIQEDNKIVIVKFNMMDFTKEILHNQVMRDKRKKKIDTDYQIAAARNVKISYSVEGEFGCYDLAQKLLQVQYTNKNVPTYMVKKREEKIHKNKAKDDEQRVRDFSKINQYCNAHFIMPLYKYPLVSIITIFLPLWLLSIINLGIFFQEPGLGDRIGSLSTLLIAFVALIPTIRQELPPNPSITLVQWIVFLQTISSLLCFIDSIINRDNEQNNMVWHQNGFLLVSIIVLIIEFIIVIVLGIRYQYMKRYRFNEEIGQVEFIKFDFKNWANHDCDKHFQRKIDLGEILDLRSQQKK